MELLCDSVLPDGAPELTSLGKQLEILRIERGVSKQHLARHAGTSRQQLWRVMTGKSELTTSLRERLASALAVAPTDLNGDLASRSSTYVAGSTMASVALGEPLTAVPAAVAAAAPTVHEYLDATVHLAATLRTLPAGDGGRRLKRALLNAVEDLAVEAERPLPLDYSEIRRLVLAGDL